MPDTWRLVNRNDVIPTVPRMLGYCHVGNALILGDKPGAPVRNPLWFGLVLFWVMLKNCVVVVIRRELGVVIDYKISNQELKQIRHT